MVDLRTVILLITKFFLSLTFAIACAVAVAYDFWDSARYYHQALDARVAPPTLSLPAPSAQHQDWRIYLSSDQVRFGIVTYLWASIPILLFSQRLSSRFCKNREREGWFLHKERKFWFNKQHAISVGYFSRPFFLPSCWPVQELALYGLLPWTSEPQRAISSSLAWKRKSPQRSMAIYGFVIQSDCFIKLSILQPICTSSSWNNEAALRYHSKVKDTDCHKMSLLTCDCFERAG